MAYINQDITNLKESATLKINMEVKRLRSLGNEVYHFGFGQSPFPVHPKVVKELQKHAEKKDYLPTKGLLELRKTIADYYDKNFGYRFSEDSILIGPGSKELLFQALFVLEGTVIVPAPSWVSYGPQVNIKGKHISRVLTKKENNYCLQADELEQLCQTLTERQKILIINSPNNPTGAVYTEQNIKEIVEVCRRHQVIILSDEIYAQINFTGIKSKGFYQFYPEGTLVTAGLSKSHSAGGYRLGFLATSEQLSNVVEALAVLVSETFSAVSAPIQHAAVVAYSNDKEVLEYTSQCTAIHKLVSETIYQRITAIGLESSRPEGAFYSFVSFNGLKQKITDKLSISSSQELANYLLTNYKVALLPGSDFYLNPDDLSFRLAHVDYDGAKALQETDLAKNFDRIFPNIAKGIEALAKFTSDIS